MHYPLFLTWLSIILILVDIGTNFFDGSDAIAWDTETFAYQAIGNIIYVWSWLKKMVAQCNHVHSDAIARDTKSFAYQAIGLLAQRMPQLFKYSLSVPLHMEYFFSLV